MTTKDQPRNPPAFPVNMAVDPSGDVYTSDQPYEGAGGMSLRDYFAAMALQGLITTNEDYSGVLSFIDRASWAYDQADAMLAERDK